VHVAVNAHSSKDRVELWAFQTNDTTVRRTAKQGQRQPRPSTSVLLEERGARVSECSNGELLPNVRCPARVCFALPSTTRLG
jgi:hypothetical protein